MGNSCFTALAELGVGGSVWAASAAAPRGTKYGVLQADESADTAANDHITQLEERAEVLGAAIAEYESQREALAAEVRAVTARHRSGPERLLQLKRLLPRKRTIDQAIAALDQQRRSLESTAAHMRAMNTSKETARVIYAATTAMQAQMPASQHGVVLEGVERAGETLTENLEFARELQEVTARAAGTLDGRSAYAELTGAGAGTAAARELTEEDLLREFGELDAVAHAPDAERHTGEPQVRLRADAAAATVATAAGGAAVIDDRALLEAAGL
jgi:prefoldin subunit 5